MKFVKFLRGPLISFEPGAPAIIIFIVRVLQVMSHPQAQGLLEDAELACEAEEGPVLMAFYCRKGRHRTITCLNLCHECFISFL